MLPTHLQYVVTYVATVAPRNNVVLRIEKGHHDDIGWGGSGGQGELLDKSPIRIAGCLHVRGRLHRGVVRQDAMYAQLP